MLFLDADFRGRLVDWEPVARATVGFVRAAAGAPSEPRLANLIGELSLADADFRTWWAERHPSYAAFGTRTYTHPLAGPYLLDWQVLRLPDDDQIAIDGTKMHANASQHSSRDYEQIAREILEEAAAVDAAEDELYGDKRGDELPEQLTSEHGRRAWFREAKRRLEEQRAKEAKPIPRSRPGAAQGVKARAGGGAVDRAAR
jgi:hypothetical protein